MTTLTLKINEKSKKGRIFLDLAKMLYDKEIEVVKPARVVVSKQDLFYKNFTEALKEAKDIANGKKNGTLLKDTLDGL
jgi:flagellin-specific chaperone FliS